jgi:hypothetical protein
VQIYAARTFDVLEGGGSKYRLSELGRAVVDSEAGPRSQGPRISRCATLQGGLREVSWFFFNSAVLALTINIAAGLI